jgi:hypothetical protein
VTGTKVYNALYISQESHTQMCVLANVEALCSCVLLNKRTHSTSLPDECMHYSSMHSNTSTWTIYAHCSRAKDHNGQLCFVQDTALSASSIFTVCHSTLNRIHLWNSNTCWLCVLRLLLVLHYHTTSCCQIHLYKIETPLLLYYCICAIKQGLTIRCLKGHT